MVLDPPFPDVERLKTRRARCALMQSPDLGQQYLTFDQARDELEGSDVKGRNPFKDLRVRRAVYHALNVDLIVQEGAARPWHADRRFPVAARRRLACPSSTSACPTTRRRRGRCSPRRAIRTALR